MLCKLWLASRVPHLHYTLEQVHLAGGYVAALGARTELFNFLKHLTVFGFKVLVDAHIIYQLVAGFVLVIPVQRLEEVGVGAGAGGGVVQVGIERFLHVSREEFFTEERYEYVPELRLPLVSMRLRLVLKVQVGKQVSQLVQQRYQEAVRVQVGIDADAVKRCIRRGVPVIAKHRPPLVGECQVNNVGLKERSYLFVRALRQKLL